MAGSVIISHGKAFSLGTAAFHFIVERTRASFRNEESSFVDEIYGPLDNEGMMFVALDEQTEQGFNAFYGAAARALKTSLLEDPKETPASHWNELLSELRTDPRWKDA